MLIFYKKVNTYARMDLIYDLVWSFHEEVKNINEF